MPGLIKQKALMKRARPVIVVTPTVIPPQAQTAFAGPPFALPAAEFAKSKKNFANSDLSRKAPKMIKRITKGAETPRATIIGWI